MSVWRPHPHIRVKAIGLHWRDGCLLAAEVEDDSGRIKGVRPLGGTIEFGETWQETLKREFREELNAEIEITSAPMVFENIYTHEGHIGHEIIFVAEIAFSDNSIPQQDTVHFYEDNGMKCTARWFALDDLDTGGPELYPSGLKARLEATEGE